MSGIQFQLRRGTTAQMASFTGAEGELTYDYEAKRLHIHDGVTPGGKRIGNYTEIPLDAVESFQIDNIVKLSQYEYDQLDPPNDRTLYLISELAIRMSAAHIGVSANDVGMSYIEP